MQDLGARPACLKSRPTCVSQIPRYQRVRQWQPRRSATQWVSGNRCRNSTCIKPIAACWSQRGVEAITPPYTGQLRCGTGVVASRAVGPNCGGKPGSPSPGHIGSASPRASSIQPNSSQSPLQNIHCPEGYRVYKKNKEEISEKMWRTNWRDARREGRKKGPGECETGVDGSENSTYPLRLHAGPLRLHAGPQIFANSDTNTDSALHTFQIRGDESKVAKQVPKHRHMSTLNHPKQQNGNLARRTWKITLLGRENLGTPVKQLMHSKIHYQNGPRGGLQDDKVEKGTLML